MEFTERVFMECDYEFQDKLDFVLIKGTPVKNKSEYERYFIISSSFAKKLDFIDKEKKQKIEYISEFFDGEYISVKTPIKIYLYNIEKVAKYL